jgi:flagellar assembly factor FliW
MPTIDTQHFGILEYQPEALIEFAAGLYAFEDQTEFVVVEQPATAPIVFLQSVRAPELSFMTLPVQVIDHGYRVALSEEDVQALGFPAGYGPELGRDLLCLVLVTAAPGVPATCNLLAPIVINHASRRGLQVIQFDSGYSHQHPIAALESACS